MKFKLSSRQLNILFSIAAIAFLLILWIIVYYSVKNDYIVPSLQDTFLSFFICLSELSFWTAFAFTLLRTIEAFVISFILAAVFAVLSVICKGFKYFLNPIIAILRALPTLAVILLLLIWTTPKIAPVIVTVLVLFPMIYTQIIAALGEIDGGLIQMAEVYCVGKRDRLFKIYLPLTVPNILAQTGANLSLGLKVTVSAEVLAHTFKSMGSLMQNAQLYVDMPRLAALTLVAVITGLAFELLSFMLKRYAVKWRAPNA